MIILLGSEIFGCFQLCGPTCSQLKVYEAKKRFEWDPRMLTQQIVQVYINLGSEMFAQQIAQDEVV